MNGELGNRSGQQTLRGVGTVSYAADPVDNTYNIIAGNALQYDSAGNITVDNEVFRYAYDYENRLSAIRDGSNALVAQFQYDALGRRMEKVDVAAGVTIRYYHNLNWQVLLETEVSGSTETEKRLFVYGNYIDETLIMVNLGTTPARYYYAQDHLYSPAALLSSAGAVVERYEYDAYGKLAARTGAGGDGVWFTADDSLAGQSALGNPVAFTGRTIDRFTTTTGGTTGSATQTLTLQYSRKRYYHYDQGRWLTRDPLKYVDGLNLYQYVKGWPVVARDPHGLKREVNSRQTDCINNCKEGCKKEYGWYNPQRYVCTSYCDNACSREPDMIDKISNGIDKVCQGAEKITSNPYFGCACSTLQVLDATPGTSDEKGVYELDAICSVAGALKADCDSIVDPSFRNTGIAVGTTVLACMDMKLDYDNSECEAYGDAVVAAAQNMLSSCSLNPIGPQTDCAKLLSQPGVDLYQKLGEAIAGFENSLKNGGYPVR